MSATDQAPSTDLYHPHCEEVAAAAIAAISGP